MDLLESLDRAIREPEIYTVKVNKPGSLSDKPDSEQHVQYDFHSSPSFITGKHRHLLRLVARRPRWRIERSPLLITFIESSIAERTFKSYLYFHFVFEVLVTVHPSHCIIELAMSDKIMSPATQDSFLISSDPCAKSSIDNSSSHQYLSQLV